MTSTENYNGFQVTETELVEKLAQVQELADYNQIRVIELLLAEVVFMEQHYMTSFHRGQKLDLNALPRFLEEITDRPTRKRSRKKRPQKKLKVANRHCADTHCRFVILCIAQFDIVPISASSDGHISSNLYRDYPPPNPGSLTSSSSSRTGQLIRCPLYPPPTAGILVSGSHFVGCFNYNK